MKYRGRKVKKIMPTTAKIHPSANSRELYEISLTLQKMSRKFDGVVSEAPYYEFFEDVGTEWDIGINK